MIGAGPPAPHAAAGKRPPVPGVIAKDAVGLGDDVPPFHVVKISAVPPGDRNFPLIPRSPDMLADSELRRQSHPWAASFSLKRNTCLEAKR